MGGIFLTALLWSLASLIAVAIGAYDSWPFWAQFGSGVSIVIVFAMVARARGGA